MTLDLEQVALHLDGIVDRVRREREGQESGWRSADALLARADERPADFSRAIHQKTERTLAESFGDPLSSVFQPNMSHVDPARYTVLAVDGSHILPERDAPAAVAVLNFGWCRITYLPGADTDLRAETTVEVADVDDESTAEQQSRFSADFLSADRAVREIERAADLVSELPPVVPAVILVDGSLVPWGLNRLRRSNQHAALLDRLIDAFNRLREWTGSNPDRAVAGYTSFPAHREVIESLRLFRDLIDDGEPVGVHYDRSLFQKKLRPGERSARFRLSSQRREGWLESELAGASHGLTYFYLRTEDEIARVEMPEWIAVEDSRVELLHAALLDQIDRGVGYPLALMEAHERAVINGADRRAFGELLAQELGVHGFNFAGSAKNLSKRGRLLT